jgi:quercetin dioxygenase-like cupin family protein
MKKKFAYGATLLGLTALMITATALATMASGVTSTPYASGTVGDLDVKTKTDGWKLGISTKGESQVVVSENRVAPGGNFGWHSHPGPSIVVVKSGVSTFYSGDDPNCTPQVHPAGTAYVDPGGSVHIARNEGTEDLVVVVTRIIPAGAPQRIDEPNPGNCPF